MIIVIIKPIVSALSNKKTCVMHTMYIYMNNDRQNSTVFSNKPDNIYNSLFLLKKILSDYLLSNPLKGLYLQGLRKF